MAASAPPPKQSPAMLQSPVLGFRISAQPFDAPDSGNKLGRRYGFPMGQGNDVGVVRVGDLVELFHGQMQKAHHEYAQSQPMGDKQRLLGSTAFDGPHKGVEKS